MTLSSVELSLLLHLILIQSLREEIVPMVKSTTAAGVTAGSDLRVWAWPVSSPVVTWCWISPAHPWPRVCQDVDVLQGTRVRIHKNECLEKRACLLTLEDVILYSVFDWCRLVAHNGECYYPENCPCAWLGLEYLPGESVDTPCYRWSVCVCMSTVACVNILPVKCCDTHFFILYISEKALNVVL